MMKRVCKNTFKGRHEIPAHLRSDAAFCGDSCKWAYQNQVRKLGEAEHARQTRLHDNLELLKQVKENAHVRVRLFPVDGDRRTGRWISGYFIGMSETSMSLSHNSGKQIEVYDLRNCEVTLPMASRVDVLSFGTSKWH